MKKKFLHLIIILFSLAGFACDESFSPKAPFEEKYVMYCVIETSNIPPNNPPSYYAILSKLYDVNGFDPYQNHTDPVILNAVLSMERKTDLFAFEQDTAKRSDTSRYNTPLFYYKTKTGVLLKYGDKLYLKAVLPNGKVLRAESVVPYDLPLEFSYDFQTTGLTTKINQFAAGTEWEIYWDEVENGHLYFPKFIIYYEKTTNGVTRTYTKEVALFYKDNKPIYPSYTYKNSVKFAYSALDKAMEEISGSDTAKSSYKIVDAELAILDYNPPLAKYYSSINGSLDQFSVRLDETVFSNIQGGIGVFGISKRNIQRFNFRRDYVTSFGYEN